MTVTVKAVFKNGQLKFKKPITFADGTPVRVTIMPLDEDPFEDVIGICKSGRSDGAENHDHYIYGVPKRSVEPTKKPTTKRRRGPRR